MMRALFALLVPAATLFAQEKGASLARYLPPETPVYIGAQGPTAAEAKEMVLYKTLEDPRLRALLDRILGDENSITTATWPIGPGGLRFTSNPSEPELTLQFRYVDKKGEHPITIHQRFALAWVGLAEQALPIDAVLAVQVKEDPKVALAALKRILGAVALEVAGRKDGSIEAEVARYFSSARHRDIEYTVGRIQAFQLYFVPVGRMLVVTTTEARAKDIIDRHFDGQRPSLATDERFRRIRESAYGKGTRLLTLILHVDRALDAIQKQYEVPALSVRAALGQVGLGGLKSITNVSCVDGTGVASTTSVSIDGPRKGLARLFEAAEPPKLDTLTFCPKNSLYVTAGNLDGGALHSIAVEVLGMMLGPVHMGFQKEFGLRLREDLLELIGPEVAFVIAPTRGLIPDAGLIIKSRDPQRLERSLRTMLGKVDWPVGTGVTKFQIRGNDVYTVPLMHRRLADAPFAPTFGVVDDFLVIAPYPISFQRFLAVRRGDRENLTKNRDFATLRERVPETALGVSYLDVARLVEILYDTGVPLLQAMPAQGGKVPHYELPDVDVISHNLYGRIGWRFADERGMSWVSHSSMDLSPLFFMTLGVAAAYWGVRAEEAHEGGQIVAAPVYPDPVQPRDPEAARCEQNLVRMRSQLRMLRKSHGRLPQSLDEIRGDWLPKETFVVPGTDKPYTYLGPAPRGRVLIYGEPNGKDRKICVLTARHLRIRRVTAEELKRLLENGRGQEGK